ncbi:MAG: amidase [Acidobacteriota bacterium]
MRKKIWTFSKTARSVFCFLLITILSGLFQGCGERPHKKEQGFQVLEATIQDIHSAYLSGEMTCQELVQTYLDRIKKYDKDKKLNSIVVVNPNALTRAAELDKELQSTKKLRPLHGIPVIVKDNYETHDLQTTAGSEALKDYIPPDDAYQVKALREAGAIVLAKSNMAEWAFSPYETVSSILGLTRNPYDLSRVPAGSSGGTAAAVAANFGTVGLGTDTGNSIRGPSAHCGLVGIRSTMGLTSRDGIIPLYLRNDIGGPMTRTVEDAARVLDVISGYDPADPVTERCRGKIPETYTDFLDKDGLKGVRIGVFRVLADRASSDPKVKAVFEKALQDMKEQGAEIVDPFDIPDFGKLSQDLWCDTFRYDLNQYLASVGDKAPVQSLTEIFNSGKFLRSVRDRIERALEVPLTDEPQCKDLYHEPRNIKFREAVLKAMEDQNMDVFVYPTWGNPPRKLGDMRSPAGDNSQLIPPHTGLPAITVPMGYTYKKLPAGIQIVGKLFGEPELIKIAYAYEQATQHRRPPSGFPEIRK